MTPPPPYDGLNALVERIERAVPDRPLDQVLAAVAMAEQLESLGDDVINHFVGVARQAGHSWAEIGTSLGVSRQAAQQRAAGRGRFQQAKMGGDGIREKGAPFAAWRLTDSQDIDVQVEPGNAWQRLVSLDGHSVPQLIAASRKADPRRWFKRLSEDLDEVYKELGVELGPSSVAVLADSAGRQAERVVDVTIAKRKHAWRHNNG